METFVKINYPAMKSIAFDLKVELLIEVFVMLTSEEKLYINLSKREKKEF